jgi:hypothetical protein
MLQSALPGIQQKSSDQEQVFARTLLSWSVATRLQELKQTNGVANVSGGESDAVSIFIFFMSIHFEQSPDQAARLTQLVDRPDTLK